MVTLESWWARLSEDMRLRDFRPRTQEAYAFAVKQFVTHVQREPETYTQEDVRAYILHLREEKKLAPSSINIAVYALRFFFVHTLQRDWAVFDLLRVNMPRMLPVVLSTGEVRSVLNAVRHPVRRVRAFSAASAAPAWATTGSRGPEAPARCAAATALSALWSRNVAPDPSTLSGGVHCARARGRCPNAETQSSARTADAPFSSNSGANMIRALTCSMPRTKSSPSGDPRALRRKAPSSVLCAFNAGLRAACFARAAPPPRKR